MGRLRVTVGHARVSRFGSNASSSGQEYAVTGDLVIVYAATAVAVGLLWYQVRGRPRLLKRLRKLLQPRLDALASSPDAGKAIEGAWFGAGWRRVEIRCEG
jgi:hypothetical protein